MGDATSPTVDCPRCGGVGEIGTGRFEHDTGFEVTRVCNVCGGRGHLEHLEANVYAQYLAEQREA